MIRGLLFELARTGRLLGLAKHGLSAETYRQLLRSSDLSEHEADATIALFCQVMEACPDDEEVYYEVADELAAANGG